MLQSRHYVLTLCVALAAALLPASPAHARDVPFVPTPPEVVEAMLELAEVDANDVVYDLGSGDGRIVITAAKKYGARGVGVDIDPERIADGRANARAAGVEDRVRFIEGDLFEVDLRPATVVTLYLLPNVNLKLRPKLMAELKPGTPVVSHAFDMGDWEPETVRTVGNSTVYKWTIPARASGVWEYRIPTADGRLEHHRLELAQRLDRLHGSVTIDGATHAIVDGRVRGTEISFGVERTGADGRPRVQRYTGRVLEHQVAGVALQQERLLARREAAGTR
jgi:SAM-dependent methyltransferase